MRRHIVISMVSFLLLVTSFLSWLVMTESGLASTVAVVSRLAPELTVKQTSGRLYDGAIFTQIDYQIDQDTQLTITELTLSWQASQLFSGRIMVDKLLVDDVIISSTAKASKTNSIGPVVLPNIVLPLPLYLEKMRINSVSYNEKNQASNELIAGLTGALRVWGAQLKINSLIVEHGTNKSVQIDGSVSLKGQYQTDLNYQWRLLNEEFKEVAATGKIKGNIAEMLIEQELIKPVQSKQLITLVDLLGQLNWTVAVGVTEIKLADFVPEQSTVIQNLTINAKGDLNNIAIDIDSQFIEQGLPQLALKIRATSHGFDDWLVDNELRSDNGMKVSIKGQVNQSLTSPKLILSGQWDQLAWPLSEAQKQVQSRVGEFTVEGDIDSYVLAAKGELAAQQEMFTFSANAQGTANDFKVSQLELTGLGGTATVAGWFNWQKDDPDYQLRANLEDIALPPQISNTAVVIHQSVLELAGTLSKAWVEFDSELSVSGLPVSVKASADIKQKSAENIVIRSTISKGTLAFIGAVDWQDQLAIKGDIELDKLNPAIVAAEWPGELSGQWQTGVSNIVNGSADIIIEDLDVKGILRGRPVHLMADGSYISQQLDLGELALYSAQSVINASGQISDTVAIKWQVASPDLADFYPQIMGKLQASGTATGKPTAPIMSAMISGQNIAYAKLFAMEKFSSDFSLDMSQQGRINMQALLSGVKVNQLNIDTAKIVVSGTQAQHQFDFDIAHQTLNTKGQAKGSLIDKDWQGALTQLDLDSTAAGQWSLSEHGKISLGSDHIVLDKQCMQSKNGSACLQANYSQDGRWSSEGQFASVPLSLLHIFSPALEQFQGDLNGQFELVGKDNYPQSGQGQLSLKEGRILLADSVLGEEKTIKLSEANIDYQLSEQVSVANVLIVPDLPGVSVLTGQLTLPNIHTIIEQPSQADLSGYLKMKVEDLSAFDSRYAAYEKLRGQLKLDLKVTGTVASPLAMGSASLDNASVDLPSLGLALTEMKMAAQGDLDSGVKLNYQVKSGEGILSGEGNIIFADEGWTVLAAIKGDNVVLSNIPEAYIIANPDLTFKLTESVTEIKGSVTIPKAELAPLKYNMPVAVSQDVIVLNNEPKEDTTNLSTLLNINVLLGDQVEVTGLGFNGRLAGKLLVSGNTNKLLLGTGNIVVKDGAYIAYGQQLTVDDGQIIFSGTDLTNPDLDIKAIRQGNEFTAGLQILGPADDPQVSLFSTPSMSDDDVLAHLILGHPLDDASATDAALLASAASGLGVDSTIGDSIASTFGLDTVTLGGGDEDTSLQLGKYLSPRLYLGYGIGIFEPVSTVNLRYRLSKIWSLKAESGTETAVDLLFTHER